MRSLCVQLTFALRSRYVAEQQKPFWNNYSHSGVLFVTPLSKRLIITKRSDNYHSSGVPGIYIYINSYIELAVENTAFPYQKGGEMTYLGMHESQLFIAHVCVIVLGGQNIHTETHIRFLPPNNHYIASWFTSTAQPQCKGSHLKDT